MSFRGLLVLVSATLALAPMFRDRPIVVHALTLTLSVVLIGLVAGTVFPVSLSASDTAPIESEGSVAHGDAPYGEPSTEDEDIVPPRVIKKTQPTYPQEARRAGVSGEVIVSLVVTKTGEISKVTILESPDEMLSKATLDAIESWEFEPATLKGEPVEVEHKVTVRFRLE